MKNLNKKSIGLILVALVFSLSASAYHYTCLRAGTLINCKAKLTTGVSCYCTDLEGTDCYGSEIELTGWKEIKCSLEVE